MALVDILKLADNKNYETSREEIITEERLKKIMPILRQYIAYWREYPDMFVEFLCGDNPENFHFYFYQRVFLRAAIRHRYFYATFCRAFSKSFLSMMILMTRCVLYPGSHAFVTTGGKEQAAGITREKVDEICRLIPGFKNEINWERGQSKASNKDVEYKFKNGSILDVMAGRESSRGKRYTFGLMEECILIDETALNEIIIPTMNVNRRLPDGSRHPEEVTNKSQIYVTTAGYKGTFAYRKLIQTLVHSITDPGEAMVMGGTWRIPVLEGLLQRSFIDELKLDGTYNEASFEREFSSIWSGDSENAFFSGEKIDKNRTLLQAEYEYDIKNAKNSYYVLGVDVGRIGCTTEICVFKVVDTVNTTNKYLVNIYSFDAEHFEDQAINIKRLYYKYKARAVALDANGLGIGLVDYLVKDQTDPDSGELLPNFGVINDDDGLYKKFKTNDTESDVLYLIKANAPINTECYTYAQTQLSSGKVKFLIDEVQAKNKLIATKVGQAMSVSQRTDYLKPYVLTSILREEMLNLTEENEGINIILKQISRGIRKDKFSAFIYGLYYIKQIEEKRRRRHGGRLASMMFFS